MMKGILFLLSYLVIVGYCQKSAMLTFQNANLDEAGWKLKKQKILQILESDKNVTTLRFYDIVVDEIGLSLLFKQNISNIKTIIFEEVAFTPALARFFFQHDFFYEQFERIVISDCNLQDEDLMNIKQKNSKIRMLNLQYNKISSQGFKYLSKMGMNLEILDLNFNSLVSEEAVNSILDFGLSTIKELSLELTSISGKGLLSILKSLDSTKLENLKIGSNHFDLHFYQQFSKMEFSSLKELDLRNLQIDQDGFAFISQMYFPQLVTLNLDNNQMTPDIAPQVINKDVFPSLKILLLQNNFIQQEFLIHLQQQNYSFEVIEIKSRKLNKNFPRLLKGYNFTNLTSIALSNLIMNSTALNQLLTAHTFENLERLQLLQSKEKFNYIDTIFSRGWPKLKELTVDEIKSLDPKYFNGPVIFPELLSLEIEMENIHQVVALVQNIHRIAPKVTQINIGGQTQLLMERLINGNLVINSKEPLKLNIGYQTYRVGSFHVIVYPKSQNKKPAVKQIDMAALVANYAQVFFEDFDIMDFLSNLDFSILAQGLDINEMIQRVFYDSIQKYITKISENFNFEEIQYLFDTQNLDIIRKLVKSKDRKWDFNMLKTLKIVIDQSSETNLLKYCHFPMLKAFQLENGQTEESQFGGDFEYSLQFGYGKFTSLQGLSLRLKVKPYHLEQFFKTNQMPLLKQIELKDMQNLNSQNLKQIQKSIVNFKRLDSIDFSEIYINKDLSFLTKSGVKLSSLQIKEILFTNGTFKELCQLNFEYISQINFGSAGIDDKSMVEFVNCLQSKRNSNQPVFPKLQIVNFQRNYIATQGFSKFINLGLPLLAAPQFDDNMDYELFNSIFTSPSSSRIMKFESSTNKFYGIDGSINPKNLRRIHALAIKSTYLRETDIEALSKFDFFSLEELSIVVSRVESCEFYKYFLELTTNVMTIHLEIMQSPNLVSTCLPPDSQKTNISFISFEFMSNNFYGESRNFISNYFQPISEFRNIMFLNTQPNNTKLAKMLKDTDFSSVQFFVMESCEITDEFLDELWKKDLKSLLVLDLKLNLITSKGLKSMQGITFQNLQALVLSGNSIGDEGINFLVSNSFPALKMLSLNNVDITEKGLISLSKLDASELLKLDLSNNDLSLANLSKLSVSKMQQLSHIVIYPTMKKTQMHQLQLALIKSRRGVLSGIVEDLHIETTVIDIFENSLTEEFYYEEDEELEK